MSDQDHSLTTLLAYARTLASTYEVTNKYVKSKYALNIPEYAAAVYCIHLMFDRHNNIFNDILQYKNWYSKHEFYTTKLVHRVLSVRN